MLKKAKTFLTQDVWRLRRDELPKGKSIGLKVIRVILFSFKGYNEDKCQLRAAALTFWTLLSIVPVFAMAFGIAKGFGIESLLEKQLKTQIQGQEEVMNRIIEFANRMLETTSGGLIAGIGILILFFTVIRLLGNIEVSLNEIWGVKEHRSWVRKFSDYVAIMIVCPILLILASSLNVFIVSQVRMIGERIELMGILSPIIFFLLKFSPFLVLWILFSFIYVVLPNTRVNIFAGFIGGVAGGTIYQIFQAFYISLQVGVSSYSAVYGSFAALPLFIFWLQISWLILLFGAEISFAYQNADTYEREPDSDQASEWFRKLAALRVANLVIKRFVRGDGPVAESTILEMIEIPTRLTKALLYRLTRAKVLISVDKGHHREESYLPARDPSVLTIGFVVNALDSIGNEEIPMKSSKEIQSLKESLDKFRKQLDQSPMDQQLREV